MDSERDSRSEQGAPLPGFGEAAPHDRDRTDQRQTGVWDRRCGALTGTLPPRRDIPPLPPVRAASIAVATAASSPAITSPLRYLGLSRLWRSSRRVRRRGQPGRRRSGWCARAARRRRRG